MTMTALLPTKFRIT